MSDVFFTCTQEEQKIFDESTCLIFFLTDCLDYRLFYQFDLLIAALQLINLLSFDKIVTKLCPFEIY